MPQLVKALALELAGEQRAESGSCKAEHRRYGTVRLEHECVAQDLADCSGLDVVALRRKPRAAAIVPVLEQFAVRRVFHFLPLCLALAHRLSPAGTDGPHFAAVAADGAGRV